MTNAWFLQANPSQYDIDSALIELKEIWWRVPQHTSEIHVGDEVAIWRSGKEAGIVGVGRIASEPQLHQDPSGNQTYALATDDLEGVTTRALVVVKKAPFVSKEQLREMPILRDHQIIRAPMGTVFPISSDEWLGLSELLPAPPDAAEVAAMALPLAFAWHQRSKGVLPMPGGYDGYLESLQTICGIVEEERPTPKELVDRLAAVLGVKETAARLRESFLRKVGIIELQDGLCKLSNWTKLWLESGDSRILVALLHSRCQLIGELLEACIESKTTEEMLIIANTHYGMGWDTQTQIVNRRGWLQSAGMLEPTEDAKILITTTGQTLLSDLDIYVPVESEMVDSCRIVEEEGSEFTETPLRSVIDELVASIKESSIESTNPDRFEKIVRNAFAFLGFQAEWLGGSGRTDVLLDALLDDKESYTVIIDCKTSGSGSVSDNQIDWLTLREHKARHAAQYVAVVAPNPNGSRLFDRAKQEGVTIISADQLSGLCRQHFKSPIGLDTYRTLFEEGGEVDTQLVDERAEGDKLAATICDTIRVQSSELGRLTARDLYVLLKGSSTAEGLTVEDFQSLLNTLASPLLSVLDGSEQLGYRVTTSTGVVQQRLDIISRLLGSQSSYGATE